MQARFYIDPATGAPHIYGHDVSEDEVIDVLEFRGKIGRVAMAPELLWGSRLRAGIYVSSTFQTGHRTAYITAYNVTGKPLEAFNRRRKKKQQ